MASPQDFLSKLHVGLKGTGVFASVPLSFLLIGLEKLIEVNIFSCPCTVELNAFLTASIFIGPALFSFTLMFFFLRPFKHGCNHCCADDSQQNCFKAFAACLIPPVMWIIILFLDGNYFACAKTDWKGDYVFDQELNRSWCKPTEETRNEKELRDLTWKHIHRSQYAGYVLISVFSALMIVIVGIHDCCISGKYDRCPSQLLCCRQKAETERQDDETESVILNDVRSNTLNYTVLPRSPF